MKKIILFAIIICLIIPIMPLANEKYEDFDILVDMIYDLNGEVREGDIVFNGVIKTDFMDVEEIERTGEEIRTKLNLLGEEIDPLIEYDEFPKDAYTKEVIFNENFNQINYAGIDENNNSITINLSSYYNPDVLKGETYLCINIVKYSDFFSINDIIDRVRYIFDTYNNPMEITSCLVGTIEGQIRVEDMKKNIHSTLSRFEGEVVEEYSDQYLLSYTIYTPLIENHLRIGKEKINLNLAVRYNEYENETYILIGTPIITTGY